MLWNRAGGRSDDDDEYGALEVIFHPQGGFNKTGSFTEGKDAIEYEKQSFLTLELICKRLTYARTWGLEKHYDKESELVDLNFEVISGQGFIKPSLWGRSSLSFLGTPRRHTSLEVSIRKDQEKHVSVVPFKATDKNDIDLSWDEHFALDMRLDENSFDELRNELRINPTFSVHLRIELDGMRGIYTTWSPSISEGRVLKFLDAREDVSNQSDLPNEFHSVGVDDSLPFTISVGQLDDDVSEGEDD